MTDAAPKHERWRCFCGFTNLPKRTICCGCNIERTEVPRDRLVAWLKHKAGEEFAAAKYMIQVRAVEIDVAYHKVRAQCFLDLAAMIAGEMDQGEKPTISRQELAEAFTGSREET